MLMVIKSKSYYKRVSAYIRVFDIPFKIINTPLHVNMQTKLKCEWPHRDHVVPKWPVKASSSSTAHVHCFLAVAHTQMLIGISSAMKEEQHVAISTLRNGSGPSIGNS